MSLDQQLKKYRINEKEYESICEILSRPPEGLEWALFSALWSEHCSYKSSKIHLKELYSRNEKVLQAFGENAGVVDLGKGERVAFKMESHNHPSFIEPYQGAATGVGGILRDIFTMGARPIGLANYLCFGELSAPRMRSLIDGVVGGISGYGNCVGVPTITGQVEFDKSYNNNILVNALAVGLFVEGEPIMTSKASGPGNRVIYVGAKTGRDGIHGASMASESFSESDSDSKRPTIQIGDPFYEKLLIEACLEVIQDNLVVAIQDMGAAGLTSSSFEMASSGDVGLDLHLDKVPLRDSTLSPEDILLSESQERMLLVCEPKNYKKIKEVFSRWNLSAVDIGEVKKDRVINLYWKGDIISSIDPNVLVENAPMYDRAYDEIEFLPESIDINSLEYPEASEVGGLLKNKELTSREWVYKQYDQRVGAKTISDCSQSVGALKLPSGRDLSLVLGGRPEIMRWNAKVGGYDSIYYPALELAAKGYKAIAATDCLNYGNPENKKIMTEFVASVRAMSEACELLDIPIISGNVSFYNETNGKNITSTPATGLVGMSESISTPKNTFTDADEYVYLFEAPMYLYSGQLCKEKTGSGSWDSKRAKDFIQLVYNIVIKEKISASRVVGKGGIGYALAKLSMDNIGCDINKGEWTENLFSEKLYQVILSSKNPLKYDEAIEIGRTKAGQLKLGDDIFEIENLKNNYETGFM